jgi:thiamine biosynthesis lipoprotein
MSLERVRFSAMGSDCELLGFDLPPGRLEWGVEKVASLHSRFSRFLPGSEVSRLNAAAGAWTGVSRELEGMLRAALQAYELSGGLVHVGVLPALLAIGYSRPLAEGPGAATVPPPRPPALPEMLQVRPARARLRPGTSIDLGGIAKGWLADDLATTLGRNVVVNLGGDLFARGGGPQGRGWPVGFAGATLMLRDQGAATSGTQRRRWRLVGDAGREGEEVHHLVDPRTGRPAHTELTEVSVTAASAAEAEVLAKAALLLGPRRAPRYLAGKAVAWALA